MDIDQEAEENSRRVQVRFFTKLKPPLKVPATSIAIPSNLTRLGLSTVVNNLLEAGNPDWELEPFDFLIDGELKNKLEIHFESRNRLQCELQDAIMRQIPDCGHLPHVQKPGSVAKLIVDFSRGGCS
ncbi:hypothetical protein CJ030_MR6G013258 [Morella rubra]|uniref:NLE domain-containing protein n=1 Tax=Morella rubra TaxID=262757 RepID=A0A6A1VH45_9ROSI|nr:hypothetical protein CJ030_MR6G013258 [Morella rubra]